MEELEEKNFALAKALIGESLKKEDLKYVDCYIHKKMGLFIPTIGPCGYAMRELHTHPSYMFIISFSDEKLPVDFDMPVRENQYPGLVLAAVHIMQRLFESIMD